MYRIYLPLFCLLFALTSVGRAVSVYVGAFYRTQYSDHVHLGGKVIWPYLFDGKARKTFGFVGLQFQHSTHKDGGGQGIVGLRHLWGRYVITGTFLGYGTTLPHAGSGWLHDAFGGLEFYLGVFSLTGVYHYPWVARNRAQPVPHTFHLRPYEDGLARMHYQTLESLAYRGGEIRSGAKFLPNAELRVGYFYYKAPEVPELQGPDVALTYEHPFGHVLARAEGLVRYDLHEGWSGRVGLWIGLNRTPLKHGGPVGHFGEFPAFSFEVPARTITRDAIVGLDKPGTITGVGTEGGGDGGGGDGDGDGATDSKPPPVYDLPNLPGPIDPNAGYVFMYASGETGINEATERSDVDVVLVDGNVHLTTPIVQSNMPKVYAGGGIELPIDGVMTLISFPGGVHHITGASGQPIVLGSGSPIFFHFLQLTVSDNGTLVDYDAPFLRVGTQFAGCPPTYGIVTFFHDTVDAAGGTAVYANGPSFNKIAHQEWVGNTINADLLKFSVNGDAGGSEFFVDVFEENTVTSTPQTAGSDLRKIQFAVTGSGGRLDVGKVVKNKLTNMSFEFLADTGGVMNVGDVVENTVEGQTFGGYAFRALDGSSLTLTSFVGNSGSTSIPAGSYKAIGPIVFYAGSKGKVTVTGDVVENSFSNSTESNEIKGSAVWMNLAEKDGEITFEGPFSQNTLEHTDRPTGSKPKSAKKNAILWFKADTGGRVIAKEAISNNTLIAEGYFGGIWFWASNAKTFTSEHPETKIDIQKGMDHLTFRGDSLYGLPGVKTEPYIVYIEAREAVDTMTKVDVHIGGITNNSFSYGPWGQGLAIQAISRETRGNAVVTVDAVDNNQFTLSYEKDPATDDFINEGGGNFLWWNIPRENAAITINALQDNNFQLNGAATERANRSNFFYMKVIRGNLTVQNAGGNEANALGPYLWSAKFFINGGTVDLGADFRTNNPNFLTQKIRTKVSDGGSLVW